MNFWQRLWRGGGGNREKRPRVQLRLELLEGRVVPTNWFVSTLGVDNPAGGSQANPFRTIQFAVNEAQSGDHIQVAQGVYGYNPAADQLSAPLDVNPAVIIVYGKSLQIWGGFDNSFTSWNPLQFHTTLDGSSTYRGVYFLSSQTDVSLDMEGFTIEACLATAERNLPLDAGNDRIDAFGGGMWINNAGRMNSTTPGTFTLRDDTFYGDRAVGFDTTQLPGPEPGQTAGIGGAGAGGALELLYAQNVVLDNVEFIDNEADGGAGTLEGGDAVGAGLHCNNSTITGNNLTFVDNRSIAGSSTGAGRSQQPGGFTGALEPRTADGLGGAAAIQIASSATLTNVVAYDNAAIGGNAGGQGGGGEGGAFVLEDSSINLTNADLRDNLARGGNGQTGGLSGGGGLATDGGDVTFNQVQVIDNLSEGGVGTQAAGVPGGGALYLVAIRPGDLHTTSITNSVIADNQVSYVGGGNNSLGGGGGGVWLQGMQATFTQVTFAGNQLGAGLFFGQALLLINDDGLTTSGFAPQPTIATLNYCIIANHVNGPGNQTATTVNAGGPNEAALNIVNYNVVLFANNTQNDNSKLPQSLGAGTFNGLNTVQQAANAGFVSPGAPNFDYSLLPTSPAVRAAAGSTTTTDINGQARPAVPSLGAYEVAPAPTAGDTVAVFDPTSALWQIRNSNSSGFPNLGMFTYGLQLGLSTPVVGDWDGNGTTTIGVVEVVPNPSNPGGPGILQWDLRNSLGGGAPDITPFVYGELGETPVVGDWTGHGKTTIGIYVPATGVWYLRNSNSSGAPDITFAYGGLPGMIPVVGDWDGNGTTTVGVVDPSGGVLVWYLRNSNSAGGPDAGVFAYGGAGFQPVAGDWNGDGRDTVGVLDPNDATWYLRNSLTSGGPDAGTFVFGQNGALPLAGDWLGTPPSQGT